MGVPLDQAETLFDIIDSNKMGEAQMDHGGRSRNQFFAPIGILLGILS